MIDQALPSLAAWIHALQDADIPVLPGTALDIAALHEQELAKGNVDAHLLTQEINSDPLMTLKVLVHVSRYCTRLNVEPPETLTGAIVMQGIEPFFKAFVGVTTTQAWFADNPAALEGLNKVVLRSRRAAHFAYSFALHRQDEDAVIIHEAAMLHSFADMMLWCHAPRLAQLLADRLEQDTTLRSADAQQAILGVRLIDLAPELMRVWQLPDLLIRCTDERHARHPQVRNVMLAVRVARHTQYGWDNPHAQAALPDDVADLAELLNLSPEAAYRKVHDLDE
jgi:HD-like signal output (HDOD) protein